MDNDIAPHISALRWIVETFRQHNIPYQIVGGLAALAHGGTRPLHDIDVYISYAHTSQDFFKSIEKYVTWGPEAIVEGPWDLTYLKANYHSQKLEIADSARTFIQDKRTEKWVELPIDLDASVSRKVFGQNVQVMPAAQLAEYKKLLDRPVDRIDVHDLQTAE